MNGKLTQEEFCRCVDSIIDSLEIRDKQEKAGILFQDDDPMILPFVELLDSIMTPQLPLREGFVNWWINDNTYKREYGFYKDEEDTEYYIETSAELYQVILQHNRLG